MVAAMRQGRDAAIPFEIGFTSIRVQPFSPGLGRERAVSFELTAPISRVLAVGDALDWFQLIGVRGNERQSARIGSNELDARGKKLFSRMLRDTRSR